MAALLLLILAAVPLLITPRLQLFFDVTPKTAVLLAGAAAAVLLTSWSDLRRLAADGLGRWFLILLAAGCLSATLSTVLSADGALSLAGTNWRRFGFPVRIALAVFVTAAAVWLVGRADRVRLLIRVYAVCGIFAALYGIAQYFGWDPWLPQAAYRIGEGPWAIVRPPSTLGHAGYFAAWLLFPVFAGAGLALDRQEHRWRAVGTMACCLGAVAIVLSGTRSGIAGLGAGSVVLLLRWCGKLSRRTWLAGAVLALSTAAFYVSPPGDMLRRRVHWIREESLGGARPFLWRDSLRMAAHRIAVGYGPETFSVAFPRYQSVSLSKAYPDFHHESPHNMFLETLVEQGVPGLTVLVAMLVLGMAAGWKTGGRDQTALCAALVAATVALQFTPTTVPLAVYFQLTFAMLMVGGREVVSPRENPTRASWPALLFAAVFAGLALRIWQADALLGASNRALDRSDARTAAAEFRKARAWGARADLWYSRRMALAAQSARDPATSLLAWQEGLDAAIRATASAEDRANAWYNLAVFRAAQNDAKGTEEALRASIRSAPGWFKSHWMLARLLRLEGRLPEALQESAAAEELSGGKHPEVFQK